MNEAVRLAEISQRIRDFIFENYLFGYDENELSNDASFLEFGILDSTGVVELVAFIESEFNIEVDDKEVIPENIDSVNNVSRLIYKKLN